MSMILLRLLVATGVLALGAQRSQAQQSRASEFLGPLGLGQFSALYVEALESFLVAEDLYRQGEFDGCQERLDRLWAEHPPGTDEWASTRGDIAGLNLGSPPCYYALLMLTEAVRFRLRPASDAVSARPVTLTVLLVERSKGLEPRDEQQLERGTGRSVTHKLEPALLAGRHALLHDALFLFREYMHAVTGGRLEVQVNVVRLSRLTVPVSAGRDPLRTAGLADDAWAPIWSAVSEKVRAGSDWWWVIYPSHVPERQPAFSTTEFITGGMAVGPNGDSPCFVIDDRWLTRKPPHLGQGPYSQQERRAYLPQWLQHEFFHHLFRVYPEFKLERRGHQWFDRKSWPRDFEGRLEADYYREALHKRLLGAEPPLHVKLRYAGPPQKLLGKLKTEALLGEYRHEPVENDWHRGTIERAGSRDLRWKNAAGVSWKLTPDLKAGVLRTGADSPYFESDPIGGRAFQLVLRRAADGDYLPEVTGFRFRGGFYELRAPD